MMAVEKLNYIKSLKLLLTGLCDVTSNLEVTGVAIDSRKIEKGNLFLAYRGSIHNGLDYINAAVHSGVVAIAVDELEDFDSQSIPVKVFRVANLRQNAGQSVLWRSIKKYRNYRRYGNKW